MLSGPSADADEPWTLERDLVHVLGAVRIA